MISKRVSVLEKPWLMLASAPVLSEPDCRQMRPGRGSHFCERLVGCKVVQVLPMMLFSVAVLCELEGDEARWMCPKFG